METKITVPPTLAEVNSEAVKQAIAEEATNVEAEVNEKSPVQEIAEFIADPKNKQHAVFLAEQIQSLMGKNWFSIERVVKKTGYKENVGSVYKKLQMLELFKLVEQKIGDSSDKREDLRAKLYKIVISKEDKIKALDDIIAYHKNVVEGLEIQKRSLLA